MSRVEDMAELRAALTKHLLDCASYRGDVARKLDRLMIAVLFIGAVKGADLLGGIDFIKSLLL